jgi:hypothetical protein
MYHYGFVRREAELPARLPVDPLPKMRGTWHEPGISADTVALAVF